MSQEKKQAILRTTAIMCILFVVSAVTVAAGIKVSLQKIKRVNENGKGAGVTGAGVVVLVGFYGYMK